jgi:hypothetical protein
LVLPGVAFALTVQVRAPPAPALQSGELGPSGTTVVTLPPCANESELVAAET